MLSKSLHHWSSPLPSPTPRLAADSAPALPPKTYHYSSKTQKEFKATLELKQTNTKVGQGQSLGWAGDQSWLWAGLVLDMKYAQRWHIDPSARSSVAPELGDRKLGNGDPQQESTVPRSSDPGHSHRLSDLGPSAAPNVLTVRPWP